MTIDGETKIYGIIGYPIAHSRSPAMHSAAFKKLGINAAYVPFEVKPKDLKDAVRGLRALGILGVNVTIPHKTKVAEYLDYLSEEVKLIGAVNTIVNRDGRLWGHNTDIFGFMKSLRETLGFNPKGKDAFVIGAGGAAKAVSFGLAMKGARRVVLTDKVDEKALELACEIELKTGCECIALKTNSPGAREMLLNSKLLVNASPCGMKEGDPMPVDAGFLHRNLCVFDLAYGMETRLLNACRRVGIRAAGGLDMLLYQGARAFELWTGRKAPVDVMRKELLNC